MLKKSVNKPDICGMAGFSDGHYGQGCGLDKRCYEVEVGAFLATRREQILLVEKFPIKKL